MNIIFQSRHGRVVRNAVGHTVETRGGEQLFIRDMAAELERLQAANAKLRAACEAHSALYVHAWDVVDGGLLMSRPSVEKFEKAHAITLEALAEASS